MTLLYSVYSIAQLYVTIFSTISLYLTKLYVTQSFALASSVTYSEIRQNFSNSVQTFPYPQTHIKLNWFARCMEQEQQIRSLYSIAISVSKYFGKCPTSNSSGNMCGMLKNSRTMTDIDRTLRHFFMAGNSIE